MKKKKILVCGASGFIGRNISEFFAGKDDFEVTGTFLTSPSLRIPNLKMKKVNLLNKEAVNDAVKGTDILIQAAATTSGANDILNKPYYHVTDNAIMNSLIFRAAHDHNVSRVIFFSCTTMYQSGAKPVKETDFDANKEIYPGYFGGAWTKVYIEKMCEFYSRLGSTKYTAIRHSNIYGPHDKFDLERSHVFGASMTKVMSAGNKGTITVWGDGKEARDLLYVSDLVDFVDAVIRKQDSAFELYNAGCGKFLSVRELVKKIINYSGKDLRAAYDPAKPHIKTSLRLNIDKAGEDLGWRPKVSLEEGIKRTLEWYRQNIRIDAAGRIKKGGR
ncbi:MAG: hypothetical protein A2270_10985 [Elusimicrobia bacterium RIFOXYA12_FULL_51_18]|nr:MAG: hypothetical protein A2270_10985 [Elusimicrobia bacterium RIFOXYA12_FULL_51_18]OGS32304.1 MAG: hypothetical protein A2218_02825 [Elusimicrobia bacterium RIFOXYA2_FULL_53_38]